MVEVSKAPTKRCLAKVIYCRIIIEREMALGIYPRFGIKRFSFEFNVTVLVLGIKMAKKYRDKDCFINNCKYFVLLR